MHIEFPLPAAKGWNSAYAMARLRTQVMQWANMYHPGSYYLRHGLGAWAELAFEHNRDYTVFYLTWQGGFVYVTVGSVDPDWNINI